jgi:hypothetical protein
MPNAYIQPGASDEIAHILAELLENGLSASGGRPVRLTATRSVKDGPVLYEVTDDGPPPRPGLLDMLNSRVSDEPCLDAATPRHMGLYVVATLSRQLGVRVGMTDRPGGGITAHIEVPPELLRDTIPPPTSTSRTPRAGSARADRWGPGPRPAIPGQTTVGDLPRRTAVATPWTPSPARPALRRPSADAIADAAALDQVSRSRDTAKDLRTGTGERTLT